MQKQRSHVDTGSVDEFQDGALMPRPSTERRARISAILGLCWLLVGTTACDLGGGGGSSGSSAAIGGGGGGASASTAVDLAPGQTTATLSWAPSEGEVDGYYVLMSRNGSGFSFLEGVTEPSVEVTGAPGDEIQIVVIANGALGSSEPSAPSATMRFHAAASAASTAEMIADNAPVAAPIPATVSTASASTADSSGEGTTAVAAPVAAIANEPSESTPTELDAIEPISDSLRRTLLLSDARLHPYSQTHAGRVWIQERVDEQVRAGVAMVGMGKLDGDDYSEVVWADAAGQIFISDGVTLAETDDVASTFVEALRLGATERFMGLADFDGDGVGDWLLDDTNTGDTWIINGVTGVSSDARGNGDSMTDRLAGHGDFDGDGRGELLWRNADGGLRVSHPNDDAVQSDNGMPAVGMGKSLAVADIDGDGRDDLIWQGVEGYLELALTVPTTNGYAIERSQGAAGVRIEGFELVGTFDHDGDGDADLALISNGEVEIWDAREGFLERIEP